MRRTLQCWLVLVVVTSWAPILWAQDAEKASVRLKVQVPQADAKVLLNGTETKQTGVERFFESPAVDVKGAYSYEIKVTWEPNNYTKITRKQVVEGAPGKVIEVDLRKPDARWKDDIVVRFVPTPNKVVDAMCTMAKIGPEDVVYDLGCGDGRMVIIAVEKFKAKRGIGIDLDKNRVADSVANAKKSKVEDKLEFRQGDVLKIDDIPNASVILLYMGEDINKRLKPIFKEKLKPGSRIVSHHFLMGDDWPPTKTETITAGRTRYDVHLWIIGEETK